MSACTPWACWAGAGRAPPATPPRLNAARQPVGPPGDRPVIGAWMIAGLCAAYRLANAGADVEISEATGHRAGAASPPCNGDSYREWNWNAPTVMRSERVGDVALERSRQLPQRRTRSEIQHQQVDYSKLLNVELQPYPSTTPPIWPRTTAAQSGGKHDQLTARRIDQRGHLAQQSRRKCRTRGPWISWSPVRGRCLPRCVQGRVGVGGRRPWSMPAAPRSAPGGRASGRSGSPSTIPAGPGRH